MVFDSSEYSNSSNVFIREEFLFGLQHDETGILAEAAKNSRTVSLAGENATAFDYGSYFGDASGYGYTVIFEKGGNIYMIVAETISKDFWLKNKNSMVESVMSFEFL